MKYTSAGAEFSTCGLFRYVLWRWWDSSLPPALILGLNPSTADAEHDDATINRDVAFAKSWGFGGLLKANLFAFKATQPEDMKRAVDPVGPDNDRMLRRYVERAGITVCAWGTDGGYRNRDEEVCELLKGHTLHALRLTKHGYPGHTLYLPGNLKPTPWMPARA